MLQRDVLREEELSTTLVSELRAAWELFKRTRPDDEFYSFGIYTTDLAEYFVAHAATEQALTEAARDDQRRDRGALELHRAALRWSPADSPLHTLGQDLLERSEAIRDAGPDPYEDSAESDALIAAVFRALVSALQQLDREGLFDPTFESGIKPLLCVWKGDQSDEERIGFAKQLNPPAVVARFERELEAGNRAFFKLSEVAHGDRSP